MGKYETVQKKSIAIFNEQSQDMVSGFIQGKKKKIISEMYFLRSCHFMGSSVNFIFNVAVIF